MRITQIMLSAGFGGAERYFVDLCHALQKRGHSVQAICHRAFVARDKLESNDNLRTEAFAVLGWWDLYHHMKIRRAVASFQPDIVHAHLARASFIAGNVCRSLQLPLVVKTHNYVKLKYYRNVSHFITTTLDQKKYLVNAGIDEPMITVIPNFSSIETGEAKERTDNSEVKFAAYGRLVKKKGMHILLRAFRQFLDTGNGGMLHIGGDGPEKTGLEALAKSLGIQERVQFHGWIKDTADFISRHDVMILPSLDEPFGIMVLEVMARARPLIATRTRGPLEVLDNKSAILVEPGDVNALSAAMCETVEKPAEQQQRALSARLVFAERYSEERVVPVIIDAYEKVIARFKTGRPAANAG